MFNVAITSNAQAQTFTITAKETGRQIGYIVHDLRRNIWRVWRGQRPGKFVTVKLNKADAIRALLIATVGDEAKESPPVYCDMCNDTCQDPDDESGQADCRYCGGSYAWRQRAAFYATQKAKGD